MNGFIKILGPIATVLGLGATLLGDWVSDRKMEEEISKKVDEAIAEKLNEDNMIEES